MKTFLLTALAVASVAFAAGVQAAPHKALLIDGQNNHAWQTTTPLLEKYLQDSGLFDVTVATSPPKGADMSGFQPNFSDYEVVVSNYNGDPWPAATQKAFVEYMQNGGGLVVVHAANNAFADWPEWNDMIGLGGWGGRNEKSGPYVYLRDGSVVRDKTAGKAGSHGKRKPFQVVIRNTEHPITHGLPHAWMHTEDELYSRLRGPAGNMTILATAYSDPGNSGTGENEPMLMTLKYGDGRIFHTTLGHDTVAMQDVGFIVTLIRGTEWAATGEVTHTTIPDDFPTMDEVSVRK